MAVYVADLLSTHRAMPRGAITSYHTPPGSLYDLTFWLKPEPRWLEHNATVVLPRMPVTRLQLVDAIRALGWDTQPTEGAWFTCRRKMPDKTTRTLHLCVLDWVDREDPVLGFLKPTPGTNADASARAIAQVLVAWESAMGTPYRHTPGVAGHDSIRHHQRPQQPKWAPYRNPGVLETWSQPATVRPMLWKNPSSADGDRLARFDQRKAYLAAMRAVNLPLGPLRPTGVEPQGPGYVRVRPNNAQHLLWMLAGKLDPQGCVWLGTATARFFQETGPDQAGWELIDSYTAPGQRLLRAWSHRIDKLPSYIGKAVYTQVVGMLNTRTGSIQRPDWYDLVIDQANATMLRRIWAAWLHLNRWPSQINVDALAYVVDSEWQLGRLSEVVKVGDGVGEMRLESWERN